MLGELTREQIGQVLMSEVIARIGCHADGRTYVVPITYAYDGGGIIGHSRVGMKIEMMRSNPRVCVEVDRMESMTDWRSVIAWGTYRELTGEEAARGMLTLIERLRPLVASGTSRPMHGIGEGAAVPASAVIYRIELDVMTGRFEEP